MSYTQAQKDEFKKQAIGRINRAGGRVDEKKRRYSPPRDPGIKVLGAIDCLKNYFKFSVAS